MTGDITAGKLSINLFVYAQQLTFIHVDVQIFYQFDNTAIWCSICELQQVICHSRKQKIRIYFLTSTYSTFFPLRIVFLLFIISLTIHIYPVCILKYLQISIQHLVDLIYNSIYSLQHNIKHSLFVSLCPAGDSNWLTVATGVVDCYYNVTDLPPGGSFRFRVACVNKAGQGPYSNCSDPVSLDSTGISHGQNVNYCTELREIDSSLELYWKD